MIQVKRLYFGCYQIGNYRIEKVEYGSSTQWNIFHHGDWCETLSTLRACKEWIASH